MALEHLTQKKKLDNYMKYLKTKFARALITDFENDTGNIQTNGNTFPFRILLPIPTLIGASRWTEIDQQLYRKYDLTADEIEFIETHVKEMA